MADPQPPVLQEVIETLKQQKQATETHIELMKSRNKILESIVPVDKDLLLKEKETLTGIAGAMKGVTDSVNAVESSLVSSAEGFVNDIFGPGLGGLINTLSIGFFTRWRDKKKEDKRQEKVLEEQRKQINELHDKRVEVVTANISSLQKQADDGDEQARAELDHRVQFQTIDQEDKTNALIKEGKTKQEAIEEAGTTSGKLGDLNKDDLKQRVKFALLENEAKQETLNAEDERTRTHEFYTTGIQDQTGGVPPASPSASPSAPPSAPPSTADPEKLDTLIGLIREGLGLNSPPYLQTLAEKFGGEVAGGGEPVTAAAAGGEVDAESKPGFLMSAEEKVDASFAARGGDDAIDDVMGGVAEIAGGEVAAGEGMSLEPTNEILTSIEEHLAFMVGNQESAEERRERTRDKGAKKQVEKLMLKKKMMKDFLLLG